MMGLVGIGRCLCMVFLMLPRAPLESQILFEPAATQGQLHVVTIHQDHCSLPPETWLVASRSGELCVLM